ncbi:MAG: glycosyltransferase family 9 protein [Bacteroidales bacterium]|nr:glycosyltransferase family 9 protein [Bacteroidales bacterium]
MKILIIRLSSIGDIVLTTPVVRCLKQQTSATLHFLCKQSMKAVVETNPHIDSIHTFRKHDPGLLERLKAENFDFVVDLQKNHVSRRLTRRLSVPHATFPKWNFRKLLLVVFKWNLLPDKHIVDRYFEAVSALNVRNDQQGLDFYVDADDERELAAFALPQAYVAVAVGSRHATKQLPADMLENIVAQSKLPMVLLGDTADDTTASALHARYPEKTYNLCGRLSLRASAACVAHAQTVLTGDTGLMHIAAAFHRRILSVWGNTVPAFGMYPYLPQDSEKSILLENTHCCCRPCSKLGYARCPLKHFRCMRGIPVQDIVHSLNAYEPQSTEHRH